MRERFACAHLIRPLRKPNPQSLRGTDGETMMKIQILGMGCAKCEKLAKEAEAAVALAGVEATVEKITEAREIAAFRVISTPAIAIDGKVKASGRVVPAAQIAEWIKEAEE